MMTKFKEWRLENKLSQQAIADALGCHVNSVRNWDFKDKMNYVYVERFKEVYEVDPAVELGFTVDEQVLKK